MSKTKMLTDPSVPRLDTIADDALVTVTDKTTGKVSTIEFSKLKGQIKESIVPFISVQNLAKGSKKVTYFDSVSGFRTYPKTVTLAKEITLSAGDYLSFAVESFTDAQGGFAKVKFAVPSFPTIKTDDITEAKPYGTMSITKDMTIQHLSLYCMDERGSTGLVGVTLNGLTIVRGEIPMLGWMPTPDELSGVG